MKTLIAIPCMDMIHADFVRSLLSLEIQGCGEVQYTFAQSSLIYDARNQLAEIALKDGFDRVLWLDSDMQFPASTFRRLHEHLDLGAEMATGLYFGRRPPFGPIIYKDVRLENRGERFPTPVAESYDNYPAGDRFPVAACGFGCVMTSTDLIRRIADRFGPPFTPVSGLGEDLSFCMRVREIGAAIWCDSSLTLGHVGLMVYTEESFRAGQRADKEV